MASLDGDIVGIAIIPHTYMSTTLQTLLPDASINLEVDVLAKYAEAQTRKPASSWTLTLQKNPPT